MSDSRHYPAGCRGIDVCLIPVPVPFSNPPTALSVFTSWTYEVIYRQGLFYFYFILAKIGEVANLLFRKEKKAMPLHNDSFHYCPRCGREDNHNYAVFCGDCGTRLELAPRCNWCFWSLSSGDFYCPGCGKSRHEALNTSPPPIPKAPQGERADTPWLRRMRLRLGI